jgi:hypothetical protein
MFKYNNTHIFTGYLKQLLSSVSLPTCKIYTREFEEYYSQHGKEDPRILESFDAVDDKQPSVRVNYLKNNAPCCYFNSQLGNGKAAWIRNNNLTYSSNSTVLGLTKTLNSHSMYYDTTTHEYLGEYLRFLRDYYDINLMSMYNCFNDKIYNNIYYKLKIKVYNINFDSTKTESETNKKFIDSYSTFDSQDANYKIYAIPVKLFADYTIAIDCDQGIELFCGLYPLESTDEVAQLAEKTYLKVNKTLFKQPFLYDKLNVANWPASYDFDDSTNTIRDNIYTRWDIATREKDLKLFIKVPASCRSSIVILEGDYRMFNDFKYAPYKHAYTTKVNGIDVAQEKTVWRYKQNSSALNFNTKASGDRIDLNSYRFNPISKLQLLAFNTKESYPFADRLIEYLSGSAVLPIDDVPDNIKRAQQVMAHNKYYFQIDGIWEDKMQNILYDYLINSGPITVNDKGELVDKRLGINPRLGHNSKSTLYDVLGYVDKDAEKLYTSWKLKDGKAVSEDTIQNVDIYNGLYDI